MQQSYKHIPRKIIVTGDYEFLTFGKVATFPYVMIFDRIQKDLSVIRAFKTQLKITSLNYGPYDNGHVLIGMENGSLIAFSITSLEKLYQFKVFETPLSSLTIDPTQMMIAGSTES